MFVAEDYTLKKMTWEKHDCASENETNFYLKNTLTIKLLTAAAGRLPVPAVCYNSLASVFLQRKK